MENATHTHTWILGWGGSHELVMFFEFLKAQFWSPAEIRLLSGSEFSKKESEKSVKLLDHSTNKHCTDQLALIFTDLFNESLDLCVVPACFKTCTIILTYKKNPKKKKITDVHNSITKGAGSNFPESSAPGSISIFDGMIFLKSSYNNPQQFGAILGHGS